MKNLRWRQLGGQTGIGLAVLGFLLLFLGWNGAASYDRVPAQVPYLISGGLAAVCVVVLAGALLVINALRDERSALLNGLAELTEAVERLALASSAGGANGARTDLAQALADGLVVAGPGSYHRPDCKLLEGRGVLPTVTVEAAVERGLAPCRACDAADFTLPVAERDPSERPPARRRRSTRTGG
jgi:hypothetical protein